MKPAEILERLDRARRIIEALPPDTKIIIVQVDGLNYPRRHNMNVIHLDAPFQQLAEQGAIPASGWSIEDDPERDFVEESVLIDGFSLINLIEKEKAAPGVDGTEGGTAEQGPTEDTPIITTGKEEVKP